MRQFGVETSRVAGGVAFTFWTPSASRRLEEWLKDFADDFDKHCEDCRAENLVNDEAFSSASIQVARIVVATRQQEKRKCLRNALLHIALNKSRDEEKQIAFLCLIDAFSVTHLEPETPSTPPQRIIFCIQDSQRQGNVEHLLERR